ncbi:MAG: galactose ABC transporter substrate-binding protein [Eubacteriales bacterium]|nr:galactose ABC transporter substrate-binding protein [Eubacteriales bacterium]
MKKKFLSILFAVAMTASMLSGCGNSNTTSKVEATTEALSPTAKAFAGKKVGVCIYQFDDNFMTLFRTELMHYLVDDIGFREENVIIVDGANDQKVQMNQIENFILDGVDVLIVNPVNSSDAPEITDKVNAAGIPLVYINREPSKAEEDRWATDNMKVSYVGCDGRQSGSLQGEMIADLGLDAVDFNKNGKVDYIMIEGDPENIDSKNRTQYSIKAIETAGIKVNQLYDKVGNWDQAEAKTLVEKALKKHGKNVEVVFCNNDSMALGALEAITEQKRVVGEDIFLVGVDGLPEALQGVLEGTITGTVFNDHITQAHTAADVAAQYLQGAEVERYIGCDYVKVTKENAQSVLDSVQ